MLYVVICSDLQGDKFWKTKTFLVGVYKTKEKAYERYNNIYERFEKIQESWLECYYTVDIMEVDDDDIVNNLYCEFIDTPLDDSYD